jgi:hypothetical protein
MRRGQVTIRTKDLSKILDSPRPMIRGEFLAGEAVDLFMI